MVQYKTCNLEVRLINKKSLLFLHFTMSDASPQENPRCIACDALDKHLHGHIYELQDALYAQALLVLGLAKQLKETDALLKHHLEVYEEEVYSSDSQEE